MEQNQTLVAYRAFGVIYYAPRQPPQPKPIDGRWVYRKAFGHTYLVDLLDG